jgi:hypothetical protein
MKKEHILGEIRRTAEANGGKSLGRLRFLAETGIKESDWRGRYWVRWSDAVREAGFGPNQLQQAYDETTLLEKLSQLTRELGRVPVVSEMQMKARADPSFPTSKVFERFGSKRQLLTRLAQFLEQRPGQEDLIALIGSGLASSARKEDPAVDQAEAEIGTVYLLKSGRYYTIGRSNAAGRREREIVLQLPERAAMVHVIRTDDPAGIEAYWHARFAGRRKNGEWFELGAADVAAFRRRKFM